MVSNTEIYNIFKSKTYLDDDKMYDRLIKLLAIFDSQDIEVIISTYAKSAKWSQFALSQRLLTINEVTNKVDSEVSSDGINEISLAELKNIKMDLNNRKMPNLMEILPQDHFINTVTSWMSGLSDTYYEYRVSSALWLLSALIQGKGCSHETGYSTPEYLYNIIRTVHKKQKEYCNPKN